MLSQHDLRAIIELYVDEHGFVEHQIASYDTWVRELMPLTLQNTAGWTIPHGDVDWRISLTRPYFAPPATWHAPTETWEPLTPYEARVRRLTYSSPLWVELRVEERERASRTVLRSFSMPKFVLVEFPVMVGSSLCPLSKVPMHERSQWNECEWDPGGYFIVNGTEKVVISQERHVYNRIYVFPKKTKYSLVAECYCQRSPETLVPSAVFVRLHAVHGAIFIQLPYVSQEVPLKVLWNAMGIRTFAEALRTIFPDGGETEEDRGFVAPSWETDRDMEPLEALIELATKLARPCDTSWGKIHDMRNVLEHELFPHVAPEFKALFLGKMVRGILEVAMKREKPTSRDHVSNKRLEAVGKLLGIIFRNSFRVFTKNVQRQLQNNTQSPLHQVFASCSKVISAAIRRALSTGNWKMSANYVSQGVAQVLAEQNLSAKLSHLRRIATPIDHNCKQAKPRLLHASQWGFVCPAETPEGPRCGIVKNLAFLSTVTADDLPTLSFLAQSIKDGDLNLTTAVGPILWLNGSPMGYMKNHQETLCILRDWRRMGCIGRRVTILRNGLDVEIWCDSGRMTRPVLNLSNGFPSPELVFHCRMQRTLEPLFVGGYLEYIDEATDSSMICCSYDEWQKNPKGGVDMKGRLFPWTHCELDPSMILGVSCSIIPFPDFNQSPRNSYQGAMGKQALALYTMNAETQRMDSVSHILTYPQRPMVSTFSAELMGYNDLPAGCNPIVAICDYTGYNQEDSVILNRASLDRGLFRSVFYRTYTEEAHSRPKVSLESFELPTQRETHGDYSALGEEGLVTPGQPVAGNTVIMGRTTTEFGSRKAETHDSSVVTRFNESGIVDRVMVSNDSTLVSIRVRNVRVPQIGDKLSSRHGQKGTCGMIIPQEDMPFSTSGMTPDIFINSHAMPSRMTIGQLVECALGKVAACSGIPTADGTAFQRFSIDPYDTPHVSTPIQVGQALKECGYAPSGRECLISGFTGEPLEALVFMGPTFYQRLKHFVADKVHARARGPIQLLNRQPVEGRAREGGLRIGEMERDCMIAHGATQWLRERLFFQSDAFDMPVCRRCGHIAISMPRRGVGECRWCQTGNSVATVKVPYAFKLLMQELQSMDIGMRLTVSAETPMEEEGGM